MDNRQAMGLGVAIGFSFLASLWLLTGSASPQADALRTELCTLAFSHAETRLDSLEVTVRYDYCEVKP